MDTFLISTSEFVNEVVVTTEAHTDEAPEKNIPFNSTEPQWNPESKDEDRDGAVKKEWCGKEGVKIKQEIEEWPVAAREVGEEQVEVKKEQVVIKEEPETEDDSSIYRIRRWKKYTCHVCGKKYRTIYDLSVHKINHDQGLKSQSKEEVKVEPDRESLGEPYAGFREPDMWQHNPIDGKPRSNRLCRIREEQSGGSSRLYTVSENRRSSRLCTASEEQSNGRVCTVSEGQGSSKLCTVGEEHSRGRLCIGSDVQSSSRLCTVGGMQSSSRLCILNEAQSSSKVCTVDTVESSPCAFQTEPLASASHIKTSYRCKIRRKPLSTCERLVLDNKVSSKTNLILERKTGISVEFPDKLRSHECARASNRLYECNVCGEEIETARDVLAHQHAHPKIRPYKCVVCDKGFTDPLYLRRHERIHTGLKPHKCEVCGKGFTRPGHLHMHKRIHTGSKPYTCEVCGKGFTVSSNLRVHERIHTGVKPYTCEVCGKGFIESRNLRVHERVHTGLKPYMCEVCGKTFPRSNSLRRHRLLHTD